MENDDYYDIDCILAEQTVTSKIHLAHYSYIDTIKKTHRKYLAQPLLTFLKISISVAMAQW
jgi:hypothetical protein